MEDSDDTDVNGGCSAAQASPGVTGMVNGSSSANRLVVPVHFSYDDAEHITFAACLNVESLDTFYESLIAACWRLVSSEADDPSGPNAFVTTNMHLSGPNNATLTLMLGGVAFENTFNDGRPRRSVYMPPGFFNDQMELLRNRQGWDRVSIRIKPMPEGTPE